MDKIYIGYDDNNRLSMEDNLSRCFNNTDYFICTDINNISGKYIYHLILTAMLDAEYVYDISNRVVEDIQKGKCVLLFDYTFESRNNTTGHQYDKYKDIISNTLNAYNIQKSYIYIDGNPYNTHKLDLYFNRFLVEVGRSCLHPVLHDSDVMIFEKEQDLDKREYKISSFNRRPDENRFKFVNEFKYNSDVLCTLGKPDNDDYNFYNEKYPDLMPLLPLEYDLKLGLEEPNLVSILNWSLYQVSYVQVVNESLFHYDSNHMFINEKTFKPIACLQPFLINGMPGSLKHLQELGFVTFKNWWDESYDQEIDFIKRTNMVANIVKDLSNYTHKQMQEMLNDMDEVLKFNRKVLLEMPRKHSIDLYNQIINTGY
tara:strand:+ start:2966 stop:4078 length:1113 start_codon:yes stop_codon:yes gene_type:complete